MRRLGSIECMAGTSIDRARGPNGLPRLGSVPIRRRLHSPCARLSMMMMMMMMMIRLICQCCLLICVTASNRLAGACHPFLVIRACAPSHTIAAALAAVAVAVWCSGSPAAASERASEQQCRAAIIQRAVPAQATRSPPSPSVHPHIRMTGQALARPGATSQSKMRRAVAASSRGAMGRLALVSEEQQQQRYEGS